MPDPPEAATVVLDELLFICAEEVGFEDDPVELGVDVIFVEPEFDAVVGFEDDGRLGLLDRLRDDEPPEDPDLPLLFIPDTNEPEANNNKSNNLDLRTILHAPF